MKLGNALRIRNCVLGSGLLLPLSVGLGAFPSDYWLQQVDPDSECDEPKDLGNAHVSDIKPSLHMHFLILSMPVLIGIDRRTSVREPSPAASTSTRTTGRP